MLDKEYGIVIFPEDQAIHLAEALNIKIVAHLSKSFPNMLNFWHVTLYHGAYKEKDLPKIIEGLEELNLSSFDLNFNEFYSTADRWVDWKVEKTPELEKLHKDIVELASPYHQRPLKRAADVYEDSNDEAKKLIDKYGVAGVMESYNPHMTLFYKYPADSALRSVPPILNALEVGSLSFKASKIVLGELGYNGNLTKIVHTISLGEQKSLQK